MEVYFGRPGASIQSCVLFPIKAGNQRIYIYRPYTQPTNIIQRFLFFVQHFNVPLLCCRFMRGMPALVLWPLLYFLFHRTKYYTTFSTIFVVYSSCRCRLHHITPDSRSYINKLLIASSKWRSAQSTSLRHSARPTRLNGTTQIKSYMTLFDILYSILDETSQTSY